MIVVDQVNILEVQRHEEATASNVRLGGYDMDQHSPTSEFQCFRVLLEDRDIDRVFLLGITDFFVYTAGYSCRLRDVAPTALSIPKVASSTALQADLSILAGSELIFVTTEMESGHLITIDGNHRAIAQYLTRHTIARVPAYVCLHRAIGNWKFVPCLARESK